MKKLLFSLGGGLAVFALALAMPVSAASPWELTAPNDITFVCGSDYNHRLDTVTNDSATGNFEGTGFYISNPAYKWYIDGNIESNAINFTLVYDGLNPGYSLTGVGTIASDGSISGNITSGNCQTFSMPAGTAKFNRTAEITSPEANEYVSNELDLAAYLMDDDFDNVQWAVRKGTCVAATSNIIGNVDGMNDDYTWLVDSIDPNKYNFAATADVSTWEDGMYCFVFNPAEDSGETNIRETREFYIDNDSDGVYENDKCSDTDSDSPTDGLGTNRWMYDAEGAGWITAMNKGKGPKDSYTIDDTYGCSCDQILEKIEEAVGEEFEGHHKFGCSKSILEDWIAGVYYVGPTFVEKVEVPANSSAGVESDAVLESGKDYFLKAYETANAGDGIEFDAKYSFRNLSSTEWTDAVSTYEGYGAELLDLFADDVKVDWGAYSDEHVYQIDYPGTGDKLSLKIYDIYYPNNTGSLFVDIIEDKWVDLW